MNKKYQLIKPLLPVGIAFEISNLKKKEFNGPVYECVVGIGKDHAASVILPQEMVEKNRDYFREINEKDVGPVVPSDSRDVLNQSRIGWGSGYVADAETVRFLTGRILTVIDALGLEEKQLKATKDLIKQAIGQWLSDNTLYIDGETHSQVRMQHYLSNYDYNRLVVPNMVHAVDPVGEEIG